MHLGRMLWSSPFLTLTHTHPHTQCLQLDGMSLEQYRGWQREYSELKRRVVELGLELQVRHR